MSIDVSSLAPAFAAGLALGAAYAGLLWLSVRRFVHARGAGLGLVAGSAMRIALVLGGFYLVIDGRWERLAACFAGFLLVRIAATRRAGADAAPAPGS